MKKIALISDGWRRLITYAWVDGIMSRVKELGLDAALYQYNSYGNWSKDVLHNIGEYNIYNLPDLSAFDGIVLDCSNIIEEEHREKIIRKLKESGVPVVTIDYDVDGFFYVGEDNGVPIRELVNHLYEMHGCRSFVFAGGPENAFGSRHRAEAYRECMEQFGLPLEENPILYGDYDYSTGVRYMKEFDEEKRKLPDAFVCANDNIAAGLCAEAEKRGYHIPEDFLVTGFDNLDKAAYFRPQITTVSQNRGKIGGMCVDVLLDLWEGKEVSHHTFVPVECIYGESCGCPNSGQEDYREHVKNQIVNGVTKDADDALLVELEADMAFHSRFEDIFECIVAYFEKLRCDGLYIVADRRLYEGNAETVFPTEGYDWDNLVVVAGFEDHKRTTIRDVAELNRHLEETGSGNAYMYTPIHFREQAVGYIIMKNGRFLFDNPYYYDIHCAIVKRMETQFKQNQLENAVKKLQDLYNRDPLTGIYNRIAYTDMIRAEFTKYSREGVVCALIFVDADNFKSINDNFGHEFGDKVLIRIAKVLQEECPKDGYACRYGGDEFVIFFPHATPANVDAYVQRVQETLAMDRISISMGVQLTHTGVGELLDNYLSQADQNMYRQKQERKKKDAEHKNN